MDSALFFRARLCLGLLLVFFTFGAQAQSNGSLSGTLLDATTHAPLPFANVVLLKSQDSTLVTGAQTEENGTFTLANVAPGTYAVRASVLGYQTLRRPVTLTAAAPKLALGTLLLHSTATSLGEVVVQGEKTAVVDNLDKKVINVSKDLNSAGGTAVDVLQNIPSVAVDQSGEVSLRGTPNITIYIDGKPAPSNFRLDQLPASRIENVEVMTNPSARYSAAGAGGVINITLKKEKKNGWNGQAAATVGTLDKYNGSLSLNRKTGKLNLFANYDATDNRWRGTTDLYQVATVAGITSRTDQNARNVRQNSNQSLRIGADYSLTDNQTLTLAADLGRNQNSSREYLNTLLIRNEADSVALRNLGYDQQQQHEEVVSADYRRTWAEQKGRELTASATFVNVGVDVEVGQEVLDGPASYPRQARRQDFGIGVQMYLGQLDYVHPLGEKGRLDVGLKTENLVTDGSSDYRLQNAEDPTRYDRLPPLSYAYAYHQNVHAAYATLQKEIGKWKYQGGLRTEYTGLNGNVVPATGSVRQRYLNLFPSATVVRTLAGDQRLQLSYSRRLNRPDFMQLLALPIYRDQRNYRIGNPDLRAEYVNALELGHQATWQHTTLSTTLFWRQTNRSLQAIRDIDTAATRLSGQPDFISRTSYRNFGQTNNYGVELSVSQPLAPWWKIAASGSFFRTEVTSFTGDGSNRRALTGTARLMNTFNPTKQLDVQVTGNYRAPTLTAQGRLAANYGVDVALRQRLFNDRAALTLRVSDLFNTRRNYTELYSEGLTANFRTKYETRVGYLGLTWFFGSNKPSKKIEQIPQSGGSGFGG